MATARTARTVAAVAKTAAPAAKASPPGNSLMAKQLAKMKAAWDKNREESKDTSNFNQLPDGKYKTKLTDACLREVGDAVKAMFEFTVVEGDSTGEKATRWDGIDTEERVLYLQKDLRRLGLDVDTFEIDQLEDALEELLQSAPVVRITVKNKDGYCNCYIDKVLADDDAVIADPVVDNTDPPADPAADPAAEDVVDIGSEVSYVNPVTKKKSTGVVMVIYTDDTVEIRDDTDKKKHNVPVAKVELVAATA